MKFAPILGSNMTGRIGGIVASHNTYGTYFRRYVVPVNRNTTGQQAQRQAFAAVSQLWRSIGTSTQNAWTLAAPQNTVPNSIGGSLALTGQALFMRFNTLRRRIGLPLVTAAPTSTDIPSITLPNVVLELDGSMTVTYDAGDDWNADNGGIIVSASPLLSAGRSFNSQYTDVATTIFPAGTPQAYQLPYNTAAGGRISLRFRSSTPDGRLSDLTYMDLTTPTQTLLAQVQVINTTDVVALFDRPVTAADFGGTDMDVAGTPSVTVAQLSANSLTFTGVGFTPGPGQIYTLTPSGASAVFVPVQTGTTV